MCAFVALLVVFQILSWVFWSWCCHESCRRAQKWCESGRIAWTSGRILELSLVRHTPSRSNIRHQCK